jgi:ABC-2 type transport system ATP-binding protein
MTVVVSSHILAELQDYSTHMLIIRDGRVAAHETIGGAEAAARTWLTVRLTGPDPRLAELLAAVPGVAELTVDGPVGRFAWEGDEEAQAKLLRLLIEAGLQVAAFAAQRPNLQESYLASLHKEDGA